MYYSSHFIFHMTDRQTSSSVVEQTDEKQIVAYKSGKIVDTQNKYKITSIDTWGRQVFIAGSDGSLQIWNWDDAKQSCKQVRYEAKFQSKPIEQIAVVEHSGTALLIVRSDAVMFVHSVPDLGLRQKLSAVTGATLFATNKSTYFFDDSAEEMERAEKKSSTFLCLCVAWKTSSKKRVQVFKWSQETDTFVEWNEPAITPESPSSMEWVGQWICLGYNKKEYRLLHFSSGADRAITQPNAMKRGVPVSTLMPKQEMLLATDEKCQQLNFDGKTTRKNAVIWSDLPTALCYHHPYIIGVLPNCIEIRNIYTRSLAQRVAIKGGQCITKKGRLFIATATTLHTLIQYPLTDQVEQLLELQDFKGALALATVSRDSDWSSEAAKNDKMDEINKLHAYHLFNRADYQSAMMYFQQTSMDPRHIMSLFPDVLPSSFVPVRPPDRISVVRISGGENLIEALGALIPYLEMLRNRIQLSQQHGSAQAGAGEAVRAGAPRLLDDPSGLGKNLPGETDSGFDELPSPGGLRFTETLRDGDMPLSVLVSTVLLKAYLLADDVLVLPFLQQRNDCDIEESQTILRAHSKWHELVCLYKSRGCHRHALELLDTLGHIPEMQALPGIDHTVKYLQALAADPQLDQASTQLIFEFSQWPLRTNPEEGLRIFTHNHHNGYMEPSALSPAAVLAHLNRLARDPKYQVDTDPVVGRETTIAYLESLIAAGESDSVFHNDLIHQYLDLVSDIMKKNEAKTSSAVGTVRRPPKHVPAGSEPGRLGGFRKKLVAFLKTSSQYKPSEVLRWFPRDEMLEERAIILARLDQHTQALTIYAHKLHEPELAERHCDEHYRADVKENKDIYLELMKVYLKPPAELQTQPMVNAALDLLARHYERINPAEALTLLPPETKIGSLLPFFNAVLTTSKHTRRSNQVVRSLLQVEHNQVHEKHLVSGQSYVVIDEKTLCGAAKCRNAVPPKRIGLAAFARLPDGTIMHYVCAMLHLSHPQI